MSTEELKKQAAYHRAAHQQQRVKGLQEDRNQQAISLGFDAEIGLERVQLADGSISYAEPNTSGVRAVGDAVLMHQGQGLMHVDGNPAVVRKLQVQPKKSKKEQYPFKILFSVVENGVRKFYVGGDRSTPTLIYQTTSEVGVQAFITNQGKKTNNWVVGILNEGDLQIQNIYGDSSQNWSAIDFSGEEQDFYELDWKGGGFWASKWIERRKNTFKNFTTTGTPESQLAKFPCQETYQYTIDGGDHTYSGGPCKTRSTAGQLTVQGCNLVNGEILTPDFNETISESFCWNHSATTPSPIDSGITSEPSEHGEYHEITEILPNYSYHYEDKRNYSRNGLIFSLKSSNLDAGAGIEIIDGDTNIYSEDTDKTEDQDYSAETTHKFTGNVFVIPDGGLSQYFGRRAWIYRPSTIFYLDKILTSNYTSTTNRSCPIAIAESFNLSFQEYSTTTFSQNLEALDFIGEHGQLGGDYFSTKALSFAGSTSANFNEEYDFIGSNRTPFLELTSSDKQSSVYSIELDEGATHRTVNCSGFYFQGGQGELFAATPFGHILEPGQTSENVVNTTSSYNYEKKYFLYLGSNSNAEINSEESFVCNLSSNYSVPSIEIGNHLTISEEQGLTGLPSTESVLTNVAQVRSYSHYHPFGSNRYNFERLVDFSEDTTVVPRPLWANFIGTPVIFAKLTNGNTVNQYFGKIMSFDYVDTDNNISPNYPKNRKVYSVTLKVEKISMGVAFDSKATLNGTLYSNHGSILNIDINHENTNLVSKNGSGLIKGTIYKSQHVENIKNTDLELYAEAYDITEVAGLPSLQIIKRDKPVKGKAKSLKNGDATIYSISYY